MINKQRLLLVLVFIASIAHAQDLNTSPFSRYGLGELNNIQSSHYLGWSNCAVAFSDPQYINISNPASYAGLIRNNPIFDVSISGKIAAYNSVYNDVEKSSFGTNIGLNNMFLGLPMSKNWGVVFGVIPYSSVGYNVSSNTIVDTSTVTSSFSGDGSLNKIFLGNGFNLLNKGDSIKLSIGFNTSYMFGNVNHYSSVVYNDIGAYNSRIQYTSSNSGLHFNAGFQFYKRFITVNKNKYYLRLGGAYDLKSTINTNNDFFAYTFLYNFGIQEQALDTIENIENLPGSTTIPEKVSFGLGFGKNKNDQKRWDIGIQYSLTDWSKFSEVRNGINFKSLPMGRSSSISVGYRLIPNLDWASSSKSAASKFSYLIGMHYTKSAILLENLNLINIGINFGVSIPLISSRSLSRITLSGEIGKLGELEVNNIEENYLKFTIGFSMGPDTRYDRWFRKRKYD